MKQTKFSWMVGLLVLMVLATSVAVALDPNELEHQMVYRKGVIQDMQTTDVQQANAVVETLPGQEKSQIYFLTREFQRSVDVSSEKNPAQYTMADEGWYGYAKWGGIPMIIILIAILGFSVKRRRSRIGKLDKMNATYLSRIANDEMLIKKSLKDLQGDNAQSAENIRKIGALVKADVRFAYMLEREGDKQAQKIKYEHFANHVLSELVHSGIIKQKDPASIQDLFEQYGGKKGPKATKADLQTFLEGAKPKLSKELINEVLELHEIYHTKRWLVAKGKGVTTTGVDRNIDGAILYYVNNHAPGDAKKIYPQLMKIIEEIADLAETTGAYYQDVFFKHNKLEEFIEKDISKLTGAETNELVKEVITYLIKEVRHIPDGRRVEQIKNDVAALRINGTNCAQALLESLQMMKFFILMLSAKDQEFHERLEKQRKAIGEAEKSGTPIDNKKVHDEVTELEHFYETTLLTAHMKFLEHQKRIQDILSKEFKTIEDLFSPQTP